MLTSQHSSQTLRRGAIVLLLGALLIPCPTHAQASTEAEPSIILTSEGLWNTTSGIANWVNLMELDYTFGLWREGAFTLELLAVANLRQEQGKSGVADHLHLFSAIEDSPSTLSLMTFGVSQSLWEGQVELFGGIRNLGRDYFTSPWNSIFTSAANGLFPPIATNFAVADAPASAMALHVEWHPTAQWSLKATLYDGVASDKWSELFRVNIGRDGLFAICQAGYSGSGEGYVGDYYVGSTLGYAPTLREMWSGGHHKSRRASLWLLAEQPLYKWHSGRKLEMIAHGAWAPKSDCHLYGAVAVVCRSLLKAGDYIGLLLSRGMYVGGAETQIELTYSYAWHNLTLQPALHRVYAGEQGASVAMLKLVVEI